MGDLAEVDEAWSELLEKDDRTSPEEYPEMCLITKEELAAFMGCRQYSRMLIAFGELQVAAQKVCTETDRIHDNSSWPQKYRAPYGAITALKKVLCKQYGLK